MSQCTQERSFRLVTYHEIEDVKNDNIDVYVVFDSGEKWCATFFTLENIRALMNREAFTDNHCDSQHFWAANAIVVRKLTFKIIRNTVSCMIASGDFESAFEGPIGG